MKIIEADDQQSLVSDNLRKFGIDIKIDKNEEGIPYLVILYKNNDIERHVAFILSEDPILNLGLLGRSSHELIYFINHDDSKK